MMFVKQLDAGLASKVASENKPSFSLYSNVFKRVFDLMVVFIAAPFAVLLVAVMSVLVLRSGMNPFYIQKRVGQGGKTFGILKMQTMVADADKRLEEHLARNPEARAEWKKHQKLRHDPRITTVGAMLRRTSLDELPQLWNVLKGDMSIVGPRPMMMDQQSLYPGSAYYELRPGITGSWQVSDRNNTSFAERARYDSDYLDRLSLQEDASIIFRTVGVVLRGTGC